MKQLIVYSLCDNDGKFTLSSSIFDFNYSKLEDSKLLFSTNHFPRQLTVVIRLNATFYKNINKILDSDKWMSRSAITFYLHQAS